MSETLIYTICKLFLSLLAFDNLSVAIAEEATALAFGGVGGGSSAAGGLLHHVGKRMELQSCIGELNTFS